MLNQKNYPDAAMKAVSRFFRIVLKDEITFFLQLLRLRNDDLHFW